MITEFLIKYWELIVIGFLIADIIVQKTKWKGDDDILAMIKSGIAALFTSKPGKLSMLFIGLFLLIPSLAFATADVTFEWDSNTESDMSYYNIYRSDDNQVTWNKVNPDPINHTGMGTETWTEVGVPDGTYFWYATAIDISGNESERSNIVTGSFDTEAPAPPQNLFITLIKKIIAWIKGLFGSLRLA